MEKKVVDKKRRKFLKILAIGGGTLVVGKIYGGSVMDFFTPSKTEGFKNFNVTEKGDQFTVSSKNGQEVFVMDNGK